MRYKLLKVGTDAEVFLMHRETGAPVSAVGLIGGTKEEPIPIKELGEGFMLQEDNVTAEFNIPPASNAEDFAESIKKMLIYLSFKVGIENNLEILPRPSLHFSHDQLQTLGAQTFGCEPDFNAWTRKANELNQSHPALRSMRTAAAHVHISYTVDGQRPTEESRIFLVKALDVFLGLHFLGDDTDRRLIYGMPGSFRPKEYGLEYRTLGNEWIESPNNTYEVFSRVCLAMSDLNAYPQRYQGYFDKHADEIQRAIQNSDHSLAHKLKQVIPC